MGISTMCSSLHPTIRKVDGESASNRNHQNSNDKMLVFTEPRAIQCEGARLDHHICKFWVKQYICHSYHHNSEGILPQELSPTRSLLVNTDDTDPATAFYFMQDSHKQNF
ncbi:hypothetical protein BVC80_1669g11 [Macleaya cordata]|uniref:Uncharacterized protein n=1 Tax=Macleaya cordata TaxID=56857 RepID=A0A200RBE4_MACCD|nr:hypothetical protein BVC80_1669g11 [Macleaya cordata]